MTFRRDRDGRDLDAVDPWRPASALRTLRRYARVCVREVGSPAGLLTLLRVRLSNTARGRSLGDRPVRVAVRCLGGDVILRPRSTDFEVFREIVIAGDYDEALEAVGPTARLVVDLGANIGLAARLFATRWPAARIVAVEPEPTNAAVLRRNLGGPGSRASVHEVGVGGWERTAVLTNTAQKYGAHLVGAGRGPVDDPGVPVRVSTLEAILADASADGEIDLLKCDIEGSERDLFASCAGWIHRVRVIVAECHGSYTTADLLRALDGAGTPFRAESIVTEPGSFEVAVLRRVA